MFRNNIFIIARTYHLQVAAFMCGDTEQKLEEVYGVGLTRGRRLPLIQVFKVKRVSEKGKDLILIT